MLFTTGFFIFLLFLIQEMKSPSKGYLQVVDNWITASEMETLSGFFFNVMKKQMFCFMIMNTLKNHFNSSSLEMKIQSHSLRQFKTEQFYCPLSSKVWLVETYLVPCWFI